MEKGYYCTARTPEVEEVSLSQSTIKMEKGYYSLTIVMPAVNTNQSQSTIKMDKGYYEKRAEYNSNSNNRRNPQ